jgi:hypothetical protein
MRRALIALAVAVLALVPAAAAADAPSTDQQQSGGISSACQQFHPEQSATEKDAAFIGRVLGERKDAADAGSWLYRFQVVRALKGEESLGSQVEVKADQRLANGDTPLIDYKDLDVGVMLSLEGTTPSMGACDLVPAVDLIAVLDKPKGQGIMVVVGVVLLLLVLLYSMIRLKRKPRPQVWQP